MFSATQICPWLLGLLLLLAQGGAAQPYSGGPGDGYARALLQGPPSALAAETLRPVCYPQPARAGHWLHIVLPPSPGITLASLCTPQGQALGEAQPLGQGENSRLLLPNLPEGLYFLRLQRGGQVHWEKLWVRRGP